MLFEYLYQLTFLIRPKPAAIMTGRVSLGSRKTYFSVLGISFSSSYGGHWMDRSVGSVAKVGKASYLIVQGRRMFELGESSKAFTSCV